MAGLKRTLWLFPLFLCLAAPSVEGRTRITPGGEISDPDTERRRRPARRGVAAPADRTRIVPQGEFGPPIGFIGKDIQREMQRQRRVEIVPNRFYQHTSRGRRYYHFFDHHLHWYGFHWGPNFYWTTYYGDRWWWYDPGFARWNYWWNGYWWHPGPAGVVYVYVDNGYQRYDEAMDQYPDLPSPQPASAPAGGSWKSPDGKRLVQISGPAAKAFLYDQTTMPPRYMKFLGEGFERVRFSGGTGNQPLEILLDKKDGGFALFTQDGEPASRPLPATPTGS